MKPSLLDMCKSGFWFCTGCDRVTTLQDDSRGGNCCASCGSPRVEFREPLEFRNPTLPPRIQKRMWEPDYQI